MSAVAEGSDDGSRRSRWCAWVAHHDRRLMVGVMVLMTVALGAELVEWLVAGAAYWLLTFPGAVAMWTWWLVLSSMSNAHYRAGLCETCVTRFPLSPQAEVERRSLSLRVFHLYYDRSAWLLIPVVAVIAGIWIDFPKVLSTLFVWVLQLLMFVGIDWASSHHRVLAPWCPWCRRGRGGGDDEVVPEPVPPAPSRTPDRVST